MLLTKLHFLHGPQIQGFFDIPVDHLVGAPLLTNYYHEKYGEAINEFVAVSPDLGSVGRTRNFATRLEIPLGLLTRDVQKPT